MKLFKLSLFALAFSVCATYVFAEDSQRTTQSNVPFVNVSISFMNVNESDAISSLLLQRSGWSNGTFIKYLAPRLVSTLQFNCINASVNLQGVIADDLPKEKMPTLKQAAQADYQAIIYPNVILYTKTRSLFSPGEPVGGAGSMSFKLIVNKVGSDAVVGEGEGRVVFGKAAVSGDQIANAITDLLVSKNILQLKYGFHTPDGQNGHSGPFDWENHTGRPMATPRIPPSNFLTKPDPVVNSECPRAQE